MQAPEHGARLGLRLVGEGTAKLAYEVRVMTPSGEWFATVALSDTRVVSPPSWDIATGPPDGWALAWLSVLLRSAERQRASRGTWPRTVSRWRAQPDSPDPGHPNQHGFP